MSKFPRVQGSNICFIWENYKAYIIVTTEVKMKITSPFVFNDQTRTDFIFDLNHVQQTNHKTIWVFIFTTHLRKFITKYRAVKPDLQ